MKDKSGCNSAVWDGKWKDYLLYYGDGKVLYQTDRQIKNNMPSQSKQSGGIRK